MHVFAKIFEKLACSCKNILKWFYFMQRRANHVRVLELSRADAVEQYMLRDACYKRTHENTAFQFFKRNMRGSVKSQRCKYLRVLF